jgi:hypothetical protein
VTQSNEIPGDRLIQTIRRDCRAPKPFTGWVVPSVYTGRTFDSRRVVACGLPYGTSSLGTSQTGVLALAATKALYRLWYSSGLPCPIDQPAQVIDQVMAKPNEPAFRNRRVQIDRALRDRFMNTRPVVTRNRLPGARVPGPPVQRARVPGPAQALVCRIARNYAARGHLQIMSKEEIKNRRSGFYPSKRAHSHDDHPAWPHAHFLGQPSGAKRSMGG